MTKYTSGMLCRDEIQGDDIVFFGDGAKPWLDDGLWMPRELGDHYPSWTSEEWKDQYALAPPRPGKCFEVDIEL